MDDENLGELFWKNVDDCLEKYGVSKADFCRMIYEFQEKGVYRKSWNSLYNSVRHFSMYKNAPSNIWANTIKKAIRVIDTENDEYPIEYCDLFTKDFFKEDT